MAADRRLDTPVVTVDGRPLDAALYPRLRQVRVEESVHLPDRFTLRMDDPTFELFDAGTFTLGSRVEVAFRTDSDPLTVTTGEVTSIAVEPGTAGHHELVVVGLDRGHRLDRKARTRTFQHMSDGAIARQVAQDRDAPAGHEHEPDDHDDHADDHERPAERGRTLHRQLGVRSSHRGGMSGSARRGGGIS